MNKNPYGDWNSIVQLLEDLEYSLHVFCDQTVHQTLLTLGL